MNKFLINDLPMIFLLAFIIFLIYFLRKNNSLRNKYFYLLMGVPLVIWILISYLSSVLNLPISKSISNFFYEIFLIEMCLIIVAHTTLKKNLLINLGWFLKKLILISIITLIVYLLFPFIYIPGADL
jgi:hypothetical protein